jgi:hypothetical protein
MMPSAKALASTILRPGERSDGPACRAHVASGKVAITTVTRRLCENKSAKPASSSSWRFHNVAYGVRAVGGTGQELAPAVCSAQEGRLGFLGHAGGRDMLDEPTRQIVTHRKLTGLVTPVRGVRSASSKSRNKLVVTDS